jgi:hypothetical protein
MKKRTAVEKMAEWLEAEIGHYVPYEKVLYIQLIISNAKALEKEQIEENMAKAITFGWELSHYHRDKEPKVLLKMQKDFITSVIEGGDE